MSLNDGVLRSTFTSNDFGAAVLPVASVAVSVTLLIPSGRGCPSVLNGKSSVRFGLHSTLLWRVPAQSVGGSTLCVACWPD